MYALADCNNFYCSCERIFQPRLENLPVIVLSNNDGCAIARSEEAKALGIKMADPLFLIRDIVEKNKVQVFSSNYALYGDISRRVVEIYRLFAKDMEVYSIDESFLSLAGYEHKGLERYASQIRNTVKQWVGIPICIGIGSSKTLAKAANRYAKKMHRDKGVFAIDTEEKRKMVLEYLEVGDVWGIGRKYATWLQMNNVHNAYQLSQCNEDWIRDRMGVVGVRLVKELNGVSCLELEEVAPTKRAICTSRSFGELLTSKAAIAEAVATHATRCAEKMRQEGICASAINVFIHTNPHRSQDRQYHGSVTIPLTRPTNYTGDIIHFAKRGLQAIFRPGINYLKAGVMCLDMKPASAVQQSLFDEQMEQSRSKKLMQALDSINGSLGRDKVRFAAAGYSDEWKLQSNYLSPCYTTNIYDIPSVNLRHVS